MVVLGGSVVSYERGTLVLSYEKLEPGWCDCHQPETAQTWFSQDGGSRWMYTLLCTSHLFTPPIEPLGP